MLQALTIMNSVGLVIIVGYLIAKEIIAHRKTTNYKFTDHYDALAFVQNYLHPATYLEIGVCYGLSANVTLPETKAVGIDPVIQESLKLNDNIKLYNTESDKFFEDYDLYKELGNKKVDLAFIDGMHKFEYALRDFMNTEKYCTKESVVIFHDTVPKDKITAQREQETCFWTGDVFKVILILKKYRPDLKIKTMDVYPSGLGFVTNLNPKSTVLKDNYEKIMKEYMDLDYDVVRKGKNRKLNIFPNSKRKLKKLLKPLRFNA